MPLPVFEFAGGWNLHIWLGGKSFDIFHLLRVHYQLLRRLYNYLTFTRVTHLNVTVLAGAG